jgi:hypothetical protein
MKVWEDCYGNRITITQDKITFTNGSCCERLGVIAGKEYSCEKIGDGYINVDVEKSEGNKLELCIIPPEGPLKVKNTVYPSFRRV